MEIAERFVELFPRVCVFDRQTQTSLRRAGATRAECRAPEIEHRQRYFQTFAGAGREYFPSAPSRRATRIARLPCRGFPSSASAPRASRSPGMSGVTRKAVIAVLSDPGHRRPRHDRQAPAAIAALVM